MQDPYRTFFQTIIKQFGVDLARRLELLLDELAAQKSGYDAITNIEKKWTMPIQSRG